MLDFIEHTQFREQGRDLAVLRNIQCQRFLRDAESAVQIF